MIMTDEAMNDLVTSLRDKTQLIRFSPSEVADTIRKMEGLGYTISKAEPVKDPEPKIPEPKPRAARHK